MNLLSKSTHIDQVLFEAFAQVLYEGRLTGVVLQQDKVLHPHSVSGCQGRLHHRPHAVTGYHLQEDERGSEKNSQRLETETAPSNKVEDQTHQIQQYWRDATVACWCRSSVTEEHEE